MKSPYNFIISPLGDTYVNTKMLNGIEFVVNTSLESHKHVNRIGVVKSIPIYYDGPITVGDLVVVHHNVFRTYYDMKGRQTKSNEYFRDDLYIVSVDRIYLYNHLDEWFTNEDYCFVKPIETIQNSEIINIEKEEKHVGILIYPTKKQIEIGLNKNDLVGFTKNSEYAFEIQNEKVYRMKEKDVVLKLN